MFARDGKFLVVTVRDPLADPAHYRAEFAAHHLNVTLQMIPASPSIVGTLEFIGGDPGVDPIIRARPVRRAKDCSVGGKIPLDFRGEADLAFGRAGAARRASTRRPAQPARPARPCTECTTSGIPWPGSWRCCGRGTWSCRSTGSRRIAPPSRWHPTGSIRAGG